MISIPYHAIPYYIGALVVTACVSWFFGYFEGRDDERTRQTEIDIPVFLKGQENERRPEV